MSGRIVQVSVSQGGIPKRAVGEALCEARGLSGDIWAHPGVHGGPQQAVLLIAGEAIEQLAERGFAVYPGALGENLTTEGLDRRNWRAGQQYRVGGAIIEFTKLREPCATLNVFGRDRDGIPMQKAIYDSAVKLGDISSDLWAMSGFYARVLKHGVVRPGDGITLESDMA